MHDHLDQTASILYIEHTARMIASVRINWGNDENLPDSFREFYGLDEFSAFPSSARSFTSRLMLAPKYRLSTSTLALVKAAYHLGRQNGSQLDFIHCAESLVPFFTRLGYRRYRAPFLDPDAGPRIPLVLLLEDVEHLRAMASPFLADALRFPNRPDAAAWFARAFKY